jgi:hypothetical protein
MKKHFDRRALLSGVTLAISLAAGTAAIDGAKAADYNGLTAKALPVVELGVPLNKTFPIQIVPNGVVTRP